MGIDIVEIWFGIAIGYISSIFKGQFEKLLYYFMPLA